MIRVAFEWEGKTCALSQPLGKYDHAERFFVALATKNRNVNSDGSLIVSPPPTGLSPVDMWRFAAAAGEWMSRFTKVFDVERSTNYHHCSAAACSQCQPCFDDSKPGVDLYGNAVEPHFVYVREPGTGLQPRAYGPLKLAG